MELNTHSIQLKEMKCCVTFGYHCAIAGSDYNGRVGGLRERTGAWTVKLLEFGLWRREGGDGVWTDFRKTNRAAGYTWIEARTTGAWPRGHRPLLPRDEAVLCRLAAVSKFSPNSLQISVISKGNTPF
jgi:hypothetical protein